MENICHSWDALLPWQRPMPKKHILENKGNYVQEQICKTTELGLLLQVLQFILVNFVENSREPP